MGPIEAELRAFIARLNGAETEEQLLKRQILALDQGVRDLWADGRGGTGRYRSVRVYGAVVGCDGSALAGSTLALYGQTTGTFYGSYSLAAGTYDFDLIVDERDFGTLNGYTTGASARWAVAGGPLGVDINNTTPFDVHAVLASGYTCFGGFGVPECQVPVANTLDLVDKFNTTTLSYGSLSPYGPGWVNAGTSPQYDLQVNGNSFAFISGGNFQINTGSATWSITCPSDSGTKFNLMITLTSTVGPYVAGDTIHIYEP